MPHTFIGASDNDERYFMVQKKLDRPIYYQFKLEAFVYVTFQVTLCFIDPSKWLWLCWIPHLLGKYYIITINLLQHDGCDPYDAYNHSRNFVSDTFNYLYFNNGYHGIHHMYPGKHWSLLKVEHNKRVKPNLYPKLDTKLFSYLYEAYINPGIRLNLKGEKLVINKKQVECDEHWFYETTETYSDPSIALINTGSNDKASSSYKNKNKKQI